jgi:PQQ-dependent dehydrogenase (methanol/ethanol family)
MRLFHKASMAGIIACLAMQSMAQPPFAPVTDVLLQDPDPADWLMWRRTLNSWGFSPLDQINRDNVNALQLAWSAPLGTGRVQEGTPLVYQGILYMPNPRDMVQAFKADTGELLWEYRRSLPEDIGDYIGAHETNRALAIHGTSIIFTTNDAFIISLDARTGQVNWETRIIDFRTHPIQQSSGPIIVKGMAISGRTCQPPAGPDACFITAHDVASGTELWRLHTIQRPGEGAAAGEKDSWNDMPWESRWHVGAWMMPSYDPELDLLYFGTSVTGPAPKFLLGGNDNTFLYHNSTLAIDPDDGNIVWHYQHLVDHWDLDHPFERLLVDTQVAPDPAQVDWISPDIDTGKVYKVLTGIPGKTGIVYTLDRETGKFLWARPTVYQTALQSIDGATGKATVNPDALFHATGDEVNVCPSTSGGKNWWAGAYSPLNNAMFYGLQNMCMDMVAVIEAPDPEGPPYGTSSRESLAPGRDNIGTFHAISVETGRTLWTFDTPGTAMSMVATGGGLVFGGDLEGNFRAFEQNSGEVLWESNLGSTITGYPISFSVNGRQFVAASTGSSVTTSSHRRYLPDLKAGSENRLFIFALPD